MKQHKWRKVAELLKSAAVPGVWGDKVRSKGENSKTGNLSFQVSVHQLHSWTDSSYAVKPLGVSLR